MIALKDPEDSALDDSVLSNLAWYHTTTDPEWPRTEKPLDPALLKHYTDRCHWSEEKIAKRRAVYEDFALHLGTYEAAIDSMLRRMRSEGDQASAFYLHRVRLRTDLRIEPGWRDENCQPAAKITMSALTAERVDGIRYLNAHEAIGSISLAVTRTAIESTQCIAIPVPSLSPQPDEESRARLRSLRDQVRAVIETTSEAPPTRLELFRQKYGHLAVTSDRPVPPLVANHLLRAMEEYASDMYLRGLSPVARVDLVRSIDRPKPDGDYETDLRWLGKFAAVASLMLRPADVQNVLNAQPWHAITPGHGRSAPH
ncbi:hypothetical protein [Arthrobacter sp. RAF14]|uniref:hypothetical protein n=1 Tax=Arthrobacter sp. RAF14 TaxID=3233051 RepID=UPI003F90959F